jgi:hypothetical protein
MLNNALCPQIPATTIQPRNTPVFPGKNEKPPDAGYLKNAKKPFRQSAQKIAEYRKTPGQTDLTTRNCSIIQPQKPPRRPVKSGA